MGSVWRASHPRFPGQRFALKMIRADANPDAAALERFRREIQALAAVTDHPGIVRILGSNAEGQTPFVVMELVQGTPLRNLAAGEGLEAPRAARILRDVADGIHHVHEQGVIHRDLKPENVLVEEGDRPRVCDFGLAKIADSQRLTVSGTFIGTTEYSAPEQLDGRGHRATPRADVYSLGGLLFFALTGAPPFAGSGAELTRKVLLQRAPAPSSHATGVPRELDAVCLKALEKEPIDRYPTAAAFRDDLARFLAGEPVLAHVPTRAERLRRWVLRRKAVAGTIALGVAVVLAASVALGQGLKRKLARDAYYEKEIAPRYAACLLPGARPEAIQLALDELGEEYPEKTSVLKRRLREELLAAALRDFEARGAGALGADELVKAAEEARSLGAVDFVGERPGFALGDGLLDRCDVALVRASAGDEREARLLREETTALIAAAEGGSLPARALRAYASLARESLPRRPLGAGRISPRPGLTAAEGKTELAKVVGSVRADLEAARAIPGAPGARAAWLLVDLLLIAGDRPSAGSAALEARGIAPNDPSRVLLERALVEAREPAAVFDELAPGAASDPEAALLLSRCLAAAGLGILLERPELARRADAAAIASAVAADPPRAFRFGRPSRKDGRPRPEFQPSRVLGPPRDLDMFSNTGGKDLRKAMVERRAHSREPVERRLVDLLEAYPGDPATIYWASCSWRKGLSTAVFSAFVGRSEVNGCYDLAFRFDRGCRELSRNPTGSSDYFFEEDWDPPGLSGEPVCRWFDAQLSKDAADDTALAVLRRTEGASVDRVLDALPGLRRLEELEADPPTIADPAVRRRLAFEALERIESLVLVAPAEALPFRARARRIAFPGRLGEALASLDLVRIKESAPHIWIGDVAAGEYALLGASIAGDATTELEGLRLTDELWNEAVKRVHMGSVYASIARGSGPGSPGASVDPGHATGVTPESYLAQDFHDWVARVAVNVCLGGLKRHYGLDEMPRKLGHDLEPWPDDVRLVRTIRDADAFARTLVEARKLPADAVGD